MSRKLLTLAVTMLFGMVASAQQDNVTNSNNHVGRKKVAVVLSGGGAKGMAHIGVLKVIEKAGIPVDIITGTSMGSIVGGLYSIGYNANALDSLVRKQDWSYVITDKEDLRNQSLSDRKKQNTYFLTRGIAIGKKKRNPTADGIIRGKNLAELFQRLCTGYTDSLDFSRDLPIPFACVATDIIDNSEVVFHSGKLPIAMRASMAIPAVFAPIRIGDKVLVDGGLRNNYPADVAREMGADIVIGVGVQGPAKTADDIGSPMSIVSQIVDINCKNKYDDNVAITDLFMNVDTKGYSAASFSTAAIDTLIRRGEEEAMRHWDEIIALKKRIGIDDSFSPVILQPLRPAVLTERQHVTSFSFENMTPQAETFLRQKFHLNKVDSIDAKFEQQLTTSMRVDLFYQTAECRLEPDGDGVRVVLTAGNRKSMQFHAGLRYDTEEYAALQLGLDVPLKTSIPINTDIILRLGKRLMARGELTLHPRSFTSPTLSFTFRRNDMDVYIKGDRDYNIQYNQYQTELTPVNFDFRHINFQMGMRWDYIHYRNKLGANGSMPDGLHNDNYISYRARLNYNSEDNWIFPTRGSRFYAEYAYLTDNFSQLDHKAGMSDISANWRTSITFGSRFTLQPMIYGRLLSGSVVPSIFGNTVGGDWFGHNIEQQMPFAGIGNMEYVDKQFIAVQLQAQQRIGEKHFILLRLASAQQSERMKEILDHHNLFGIQGSYYIKTLFGPVGASFGYSNHTKKPHLFINLGYEF